MMQLYAPQDMPAVSVANSQTISVSTVDKRLALPKRKRSGPAALIVS